MNTKTKSLKLQICDRILNEQGGALTPKETAQQKAAREKAAAEKKAAAAKDKTVVANSDISDIDPAKIAHYYDIANWTAIALGTVVLGYLGVKTANKIITNAALRQGITKGNALRWMIRDGITSSLANKSIKFWGWPNFISGVETHTLKLGDDLAKSKSDDDMLKRTGLTRTEARVLIDEIGTTDWNSFKKTFESEARLEYYKNNIELDDYILAAGYAGNPTSKKIAETWMPIIKKAATGGMTYVKLSTINDIDKFKTWFGSALSWTEKYWKDMPELKDMPDDYRLALRSRKPGSLWYEYYQDKKPEAINYVADRINQIIKNTTVISEDILNIANTTNSFPAYKKWSAIQTVTRRPSDVNTFLRQKFCWYAQKHSI